MASLLKWVAYSSVQPSTAIQECTMAWRTEGSMRAFAPHSHACPLKSLAQPDGKEGRDLFQESNPRAAKVWKILISPLCQWVSKQSLFSKINWIHKKVLSSTNIKWITDNSPGNPTCHYRNIESHQPELMPNHQNCWLETMGKGWYKQSHTTA